MKKKLTALVHALLYPLIYIASQVVATVVTVFVYAVGKVLDGTMTQTMLSAEGFAKFQQEFVSEYAQQILIVSCILTCAVVLLVVKGSRRKMREYFTIRRLPLNKAIVLILLGVSVNLATVYAINIIPIPESVLTQYEELVANTVISDNIWLTFLTTALLVPITEELVFRGMSFNLLRRGFSLAVALILQTLLFAGAHLLPLQIAYVLPTAIILGLVYVWCGSFVAPLLLHISYNGVSAVASAIATTAGETAEQTAAAGYLPYFAGFLAATCVCLLYLYLKRDRRGLSDPV